MGRVLGYLFACVVLFRTTWAQNNSCSESCMDIMRNMVEALQSRITNLEEVNIEFRDKFKRQARRLKRLEEEFEKNRKKSYNGNGGVACLPPTISNGMEFSPVRPVGLYPADYEITVRCADEGSSLVGESKMKCFDGGYWTEPNIKCEENYCKISTERMNDKVFIQGFTVDELQNKMFAVSDSVTVGCPTPLRPYAVSKYYEEPVITCMTGQKWSMDPAAFECHIPAQFMDLMFVLDGSESVGFENFEIVKSWVLNITRKFELSKYTMVGVIQYSHFYDGFDIIDQPYLATEAPLSNYANHTLFETQIEQIAYQGYTTYTAHAIEKAVIDFSESERFNDSRTTKIMVLVTDGSAVDFELLRESAEYADSQGIIIYAVGVADFSRDDFAVIANVSDEGYTRIYDVFDFEELHTIVDLLAEDIAADAEDLDEDYSECFVNATLLMPGVTVFNYSMEDLESVSFGQYESIQLSCPLGSQPFLPESEYVAPYTTCQPDQKWSTDLASFECRKVCEKPPPISKGNWNEPNLRQFYGVKETLWFSCEEGYMNGEATSSVTCLPEGKWSSSSDLCEPKK